MRVLIFGAKGWIGNMFHQYLKDHMYPPCDIFTTDMRADSEEVKNLLHTLRPSHVVCMVGRTSGPGCPSIDYLQDIDRLDANVNDNLFAPMYLALICKELGIHLTYLGTGCIFEYDHSHPFGSDKSGFTESDIPNFKGSAYSIVKGYTDRLMHHLDSNVLNLRIRMPITADLSSPRNFLTKITNYERICSIPNSMSVLPTLFPCILQMMQKSVTGTVNLCNPGLISHNEILELYRDLVDPAFKWQNFSLEEQSQILKAGRSNNCLDTTLLRTLCPTVPDIRTAVISVLKK